ncbi:hypothetical protein ASE90_12835 [Sphingomonas sp. Leaf67]|uniref:hypothetical protein n=1 Tax=Sphingomonas sp. Leaf67 TaxID=1736230 RepID=UPI0007135D89|nr:hypothetical protein [Sphingomonas sp. Leaf67]KQN81464.1 hypothetical protein ASE90_12835 [Sphingomonas sp. Leaf67]
MQFQLSCAAIVATLAVPAAAQQAQPGGSIPIYDITPQVAPTPVPTSTPIATPTPRGTPSPTPRAPRAPVPTATPTPPAPRPRVTPSPTSSPAPVATPAAAPAPQATYAGPPVLPTPAASPTPDLLPTPAAQPAPAPTGDALPWWLWFLVGIVVATGVALLFARRRRRSATVVDDAVPVPDLPPEPVAPPAPPRAAPPPPAPVVPPPPAAPAPTPGPFLEFQLAPIRVGTENERILLDFDLTVGNPASMPVTEVSVATMLLTAHAGQDDAIADFFANDGKRGLDPFALGAGEQRHLEATMTLPRVAVNIVTARDRPFFVPMIAIDARYRWEDGRESRTTAAFMVGPAAPQGKLAPIFTDRGDRMTDRLEVRLYGQVRRT